MRTFFIGDIHGCADEFDALLQRIDYKPSRDRLFLVGDCFTRGPEPVRVFERIIETGAKCVLGNHDYKMHVWMRHEEGQPHPDVPVSKSKKRAVELIAPRRDEIKKWIASLPLYIETGDWILVHAAIHPLMGLPATTLDIATTWRTFPGPIVPDAQKWYKFYRGPKPVIFGHDSLGRLVRWSANGKPLAIGLDTRCVYGECLTAYHFEKDAFHCFPAKREYHPV